jgi:thiol:disulfide interchange protein DsbD
MPAMKNISVVTTIALCLLSCALVQAEDTVVSVRAIGPGEPLKAGNPSVLTVELDIADHYHINSDKPLEDFLIPTTLELEPHPGIAFGETVFPPAEIKNFRFSDSPMAVFEGMVKIAVEMMPASGAASGNTEIRGKVRYQACDNTTCLPPVRQPFSLTVSVENPGVFPFSSKTAPISPQIGKPAEAEAVSPPSESMKGETASPKYAGLGEQGLFVTFLLVFVGGLALNLTPCVYPMIPITITYFGGQAQGKKGSIVLHALLYVIGMAVTYSILGVAAATTGGLFGAAYQYPPVLIAFSFIMILLALSMFDVYELRMPASLNRLASGSQKGFGGTFLMGLTVGIIAAPCIGPFVLGLLSYVGNRGNVVLGFALFFILALGLGVPFLVLGVFSGSIHKLPRSGAWMVWVRKIFGFILLAMAVYFLKNLLPGLLAYHLTLALIMLLAGIYLAWIDPVQAPGKAFPYIRNAVGILFFGACLYIAVMGLQAGIGNIQIHLTDQDPGSSIQWLSYSEAISDQASMEVKPMLIDFYADWCAPCKELDIHTFTDPEIIDKSKEFYMIKVDLTSSGNTQGEALRKKYGARGVPTLVFLDPEGQEIPDLRVVGFEPSDAFVGKMIKAIQLSADRRKSPR